MDNIYVIDLSICPVCDGTKTIIFGDVSQGLKCQCDIDEEEGSLHE